MTLISPFLDYMLKARDSKEMLLLSIATSRTREVISCITNVMPEIKELRSPVSLYVFKENLISQK